MFCGSTFSLGKSFGHLSKIIQSNSEHAQCIFSTDLRLEELAEQYSLQVKECFPRRSPHSAHIFTEVYGMPYADWKKKYQKPATAEQLLKYEKSHGDAHAPAVDKAVTTMYFFRAGLAASSP